MSERETPICHRTIGPEGFIHNDDGRTVRTEVVPRPCIGSRCALWAVFERGSDSEIDYCDKGSGVCSDNLLSMPWPDPAEVTP